MKFKRSHFWKRKKNGETWLEKGATFILIAGDRYNNEPDRIPIDYPHLPKEAKVGIHILPWNGHPARG